jgi:ketosteroid isomerase-like protein
MIDHRSLITTAIMLAAIAAFTQPVRAVDIDHDEILALYQGWIRAVESSNIDGYVNGLHPDVSLRPPGVPGLDGRANYREFLEPVFETARYEITIDTPHAITMMGDAAVVEYDYTILRIVDASAAADLPAGALDGASTTSHYIDVVAKDGSGAWKIRLHSWSVTP